MTSLRMDKLIAEIRKELDSMEDNWHSRVIENDGNFARIRRALVEIERLATEGKP